MKWFRNLRISLKLVLIFGIAVIPYIFMGVFTFLHSQELTRKTEKIIDLWIPAMICVDGLTISIENLRIKEYKYVLSSDLSGKKSIEEEIRIVDDQISQYLKRLSLLVQTEEEQKIFKEFHTVYSFYKKIWLKISALANQNNSLMAERILIGESRKAYQKQIILLKHLVQTNQNRVLLSINRIHSTNVSATLFFSTLPIITLILITILFIFMTRSIIDSIKVLDLATNELAKNKRFIPIKVTSNDEIGSLTNSFNQMGKDVTNSINKLNQLNETLEQKVNDRTMALQKSDRMKSVIFSIIGHDLKNSFSTILGYTSILSHESNELNPEEIHRYNIFINSSARNAYRLLENLFEWARYESNSIEFKPEIIDVSTFFEEVIRNESSLLEQKKVSTRIISSHNSTAFCDPNMVKTIIRNLFHNAVKYSFEGGEITLSVINSGNMIEVSVRDLGIGMSSKQIETLFNDSITPSLPGTNNEKGSGFGLIICKEFIQRIGGTIQVESKPGQGTKFIFTIPKGAKN
ncbi:MAG: HAMP domain-containing protein [Alphaproteobacteria bacterium]|nr:HAMP domain-containing protein [Alphaproteobacteria bacterium]